MTQEAGAPEEGVTAGGGASKAVKTCRPAALSGHFFTRAKLRSQRRVVLSLRIFDYANELAEAGAPVGAAPDLQPK